jgi:hypothetical protein
MSRYGDRDMGGSGGGGVIRWEVAVEVGVVEAV